MIESKTKDNINSDVAHNFSFEGILRRVGGSRALIVPRGCSYKIGEKVYVDLQLKESRHNVLLSGKLGNLNLRSEKYIKDAIKRISEPFSKNFGKITLIGTKKIKNPSGQEDILLDIKYETKKGSELDKWEVQSAILNYLQKENIYKKNSG